MTLTQSDLKAIDNLIVKRITPLKKGQVNLEIGQAKLEKGQSKLEKGQAKLEKGLRKLQRGQKLIVKHFDRNYLDHEKRIRKIETKLDIPLPDITKPSSFSR